MSAPLERREMAQELLLEKLEGLASKAQSLESEKAEAIARMRELEREVGELKDLISLAESKVDEMVEGGLTTDVSRGQEPRKAQVTSAPASKGLEELAEASASEQNELRRRFPHASKQHLF
jgi:DNA-binding protein H-NS